MRIERERVGFEGAQTPEHGATPGEAVRLKMTPRENERVTIERSIPESPVVVPERGLQARLASVARGLISGMKSTVLGIGHALVESGAALVSGLGAFSRGDFGKGFEGLGKFALGLVGLPFDATLMLGGSLVSAAQTAVGLEPVGTPLSPAQKETLRKVFGTSVDLDAIVLKEGSSGVLTIGSRPFTHGNTIYVPRKWLPLTDQTLVHETVHVWQHQHGGTDYMSGSIWAQNFGDGYQLEPAFDAEKDWDELNPEQQARVIEGGFVAGWFDDPSKPVYLGSRDQTVYFIDALAALRNGKGAP